MIGYKRLFICLTLMVLCMGFTNTSTAQEQTAHQSPAVVSTELFPYDGVDFFTNDLHYFFSYGPVSELINAENSSDIFFSFEAGLLAGWSLDDSHLAFMNKREPCISDEDESNLIVFNTQLSQVAELCIPFGHEVESIQWSPFDTYQLALIGPNKFYNIQTQELSEDSFTYPREIEQNDLADYIGYNRYLWDTTTLSPIAQITLKDRIETNLVTESEFQVCSNQCISLLDTLEAAPNSGSVIDWQLWGHWLLWGVHEFVDGEPHLSNSDTRTQISDGVVYLTNLQTNLTEPLFRFSSLGMTGITLGGIGWSSDGRTIALPLTRTNSVPESPSPTNNPWFSIGSVLLHLNWPPIANAGIDQSVTTSEGEVSVTLDGSGSTDSDGTIQSYYWYEGENLVADGSNTTANLPLGTHTLTLVVEDNTGLSATDEIVIEVVRTPLNSPSELSAQALNPSQIQLTWTDNSDDETSYTIERSDDVNGWMEIGVVDADITTYTDTDTLLWPSTTYYYHVRAYRDSDHFDSEFSNEASVLTASAPPSNLAVVAAPSGKVDLSWEDNSGDETTFSIERSPDGITNWVVIDTIPADTVDYEDTGLTRSTTYWYRVRAHRESDNQFSDYTPSVSVLTAPTDLSQATAAISAPNQIQISWTDNSTDESEFRIERSANGVDWSEIGTVVADAITYRDTTANPSTTYYYRVRAYRSSDSVFSAYSAASSSVLSSPATPVGFAGVPLPINKAKLIWTDNSTDETNFRLERSDNGTSGWSEIIVPANQATYTETRTNCIQTSYYRIRAYRGSDNQYSAYSPVVSVITDGCGPDRLALFNTVHTHNRRFTDFPGTSYNDYWLNAPVASGLWVMGDWDGNGVDTPAVFNQDTNTFAFTNDTGATGTWVSMTLTVDGVPVAGRFNGNRANDCLGVVDDIPFGADTAFALWFVCDYTNLSPNIAELGYQWMGAILADSAGFSGNGVHQFGTGDFNADGVDTIAVRRGPHVAYGNVPPTTQLAAIDLAQYFGNPYNGQYGGLYGILVVGDWNYDRVDTFGYFYEDGNFYWRNHLEWNQPISGSALISQPYGAYVLATTWRN